MNTKTILVLAATFAALFGCVNTTPPQEKTKPAAPMTAAPDTNLITKDWYCATIEQPARPKNKIQQAVGAKGKFWPVGAILKVGFIKATPDQIAAVKKYAPEWSQYANVKFDFDAAPPYDLRVAFDEDNGAWSYVGTDAKHIPQSKPTINLGWLGRDVICHEFGHALGLYHEHQNPTGGICWNRANVIKDLSGPPNNWTVRMIQSNVLNKINPNDVLTTPWDKFSIMHYPIPASWTCNNTAIPGGVVISPTDILFIKSIYPGATPPTNIVTLSGQQVEQITALLDARQSEADTTAARLRRTIEQIKLTIKPKQ